MIDFHAHMAPETAIAAARRAGFMSFQKRVSPALFDIEAQEAQMASQGLTIRYLSVPPILYGYELEQRPAAAHVAKLNDWIFDVTDRPTFRATGILPLTCASASLVEARRLADMGVRSIAVGSHIHGRPLDALDDELWSAAAELFDFVLLHPWNPRAATLLEDPSLTNPIGNPVETTIAAIRLITSGVLERHPQLTFLLAHGGGSLPYLLGRIRRAWAARQLPDPRDSLRRFLYDTVVFESAQVRLLVETVGADRIVLGTDSPFDMSIENPLALAADAGWNPELAKDPEAKFSS